MTFERMPGPAGAEPAPPAIAGADGGGSPVALRLQVLATEHWGLLATRSLAWNESFTRAGMFLTTLSGAIVALALVAQATEFGSEFVLFALVILPVVLFIGITTFLRMGASNYYDALCVVGMNRIRHAYMQITPEVEPYLVMGTHDDEASVGLSMGTPPGNQPRRRHHRLHAVRGVRDQLGHRGRDCHPRRTTAWSCPTPGDRGGDRRCGARVRRAGCSPRAPSPRWWPASSPRFPAPAQTGTDEG